MTDVSDPSSTTTSERDAGHGPLVDERALIVAVAGIDLQAMERIASELPAGLGMAFMFVVGPSASPRQLSPERLAGVTTLKVEPARTGLRIQADHLYVVQQGAFVSCESHTLTVAGHDSGSMPLDHLFRSLAHQGDRSAAIILSGIRGDGSVGVAEMRAAGSFIILQVPLNATEANAPEQLLFAKGADVVLPLSRVVGALTDYFQPSAERDDNGSALFNQATLAPILSVLGETTGHDFTRYKRTTVSRRVQRRMRVHGLAEPSITWRCSRPDPLKRSSCSTRC